MLDKVIKTISDYNLINNKDHILVGVSGGADSMCLFHILDRISSTYDAKISVIHINHMIREEAKDDETYVLESCKKYNIPFYAESVDVIKYSKENKMSEEEAGRILRYEAIQKCAKKINANKIAIAHNMNDQAETVFLNLLRGTGIEGLKGILYKKDNLIRPLLGIKREEIINYCKDNNIEYRTDKTNFMSKYMRNSVRLKIFPYIKENTGIDVTPAFVRLSKLAKTDNSFIETIAVEKYAECKMDINDKKISLDIDKLVSNHEAIASRIIRKAIEEISGSIKNVGYRNISIILDFINKKETGKEINIQGNLMAWISYNILYIGYKKNKEDIILELKIPGITLCNTSGVLFKAAVYDKGDELIKNSNFVYFDYDKIEDDIYIRNRKEGDYIKPTNLNGTKKIKDIFIDKKIPREERDEILLLSIKSEILWIPGIRESRSYSIDGSTKKILCVEIKRRK